MDEKGEKPAQSSKFSRRRFVQGVAALGAVAALAPQEALAQTLIYDEKSPEFFRNLIANKLKPGNRISVVPEVVRISAKAERLYNLPGKSVISEDLKDAPFVDQKIQTQSTPFIEVENSVVFEYNGVNYLLIDVSAEEGLDQPVAIALKPANYGEIAHVDAEGSISFFSQEQNGLPTKTMIVSGEAETNRDGQLKKELFAKDINGKISSLMKLVPKKA